MSNFQSKDFTFSHPHEQEHKIMDYELLEK